MGTSCYGFELDIRVGHIDVLLACIYIYVYIYIIMSQSSRKTSKMGHITIIPRSSERETVPVSEIAENPEYIGKCFKKVETLIMRKGKIQKIYNDLGMLLDIRVKSTRFTRNQRRKLDAYSYKLTFLEQGTGAKHTIRMFPTETLILVNDCDLLRESIIHYGGRKRQTKRILKKHKSK